MSPTRTIIAITMEWQGISLEITYEPNWLNMSGRDPSLGYAHLEVRSISPERARLPITETGYRSHFLHVEEIDDVGGPVAYVTAWLCDMATSREWLEHEQCSRQLSLF